MNALEPVLDRARAAKTRLKLWNAELDRLRYPAYYRGRLSPEEANLLLYNRLRQGVPVATVIGGGYDALSALVARHSLVFHAAAELGLLLGL